MENEFSWVGYFLKIKKNIAELLYDKFTNLSLCRFLDNKKLFF